MLYQLPVFPTSLDYALLKASCAKLKQAEPEQPSRGGRSAWSVERRAGAVGVRHWPREGLLSLFSSCLQDHVPNSPADPTYESG